MSNQYNPIDRGKSDPFHLEPATAQERRDLALLHFALGQYDGCFVSDDLLAILDALGAE